MSKRIFVPHRDGQVQKIKLVYDPNPINEQTVADALNRYYLIKAGKRPNAFKAINDLLTLGEIFIQLYLRCREIMKTQRQLLDSLEKGIEFPNSGQPWTPDEEEALVEWAAAGDSVMELARALGRTPAAISTRLSYLIGIRQDAIQIDGGQLQGLLDFEMVEGTFTGIIRR